MPGRLAADQQSSRSAIGDPSAGDSADRLPRPVNAGHGWHGATPGESRAWLEVGATAVGVSVDVGGTAEKDGEAAVTESMRRYLAAVRA
jgi:hypothetical protein